MDNLLKFNTKAMERTKRKFCIDEQNNVVYKEPIKIKDWIHIINSSVVQENKTDEVSRWVEHPGHWERPPKSQRIWWRIGTFGIYGGPKRYVRDPDITHITYHQFRRDKITNPDNNITFTDWIKIGEWTT
ncbi:hypothetical protein M9Y10_038497 [Tritrichomonas musculus]|uniref:Uncharacterized protein n=1 Tax=Tritrichomonas musculus TaxID=1915356 RepID=A0ABR2K8J5_9EUKA